MVFFRLDFDLDLTVGFWDVPPELNAGECLFACLQCLPSFILLPRDKGNCIGDVCGLSTLIVDEIDLIAKK